MRLRCRARGVQTCTSGRRSRYVVPFPFGDNRMRSCCQRVLGSDVAFQCSFLIPRSNRSSKERPREPSSSAQRVFVRHNAIADPPATCPDGSTGPSAVSSNQILSRLTGAPAGSCPSRHRRSQISQIHIELAFCGIVFAIPAFIEYLIPSATQAQNRPTSTPT